MEIKELILKYEKEAEYINDEIEKRLGTEKRIGYLKGMRFSIYLFISDLKKLSSESKCDCRNIK